MTLTLKQFSLLINDFVQRTFVPLLELDRQAHQRAYDYWKNVKYMINTPENLDYWSFQNYISNIVLKQSQTHDSWDIRDINQLNNGRFSMDEKPTLIKAQLASIKASATFDNSGRLGVMKGINQPPKRSKALLPPEMIESYDPNSRRGNLEWSSRNFDRNDKFNMNSSVGGLSSGDAPKALELLGPGPKHQQSHDEINNYNFYETAMRSSNEIGSDEYGTLMGSFRKLCTNFQANHKKLLREEENNRFISL